MKTETPPPPGISPEIRDIYDHANQILSQNRAIRRRLRVKNLIKTLIGICIILALLTGALIAYNNRSALLNIFKGLLPGQTPQGEASLPQSSECPELFMTVDDEGLKPSIPVFGRCYTIPSDHFTAWTKVFSQSKNITTFAAAIGGDQDFVQTALQNSLQTQTLDLRSSASVTPTALPSATPTKIPQYAERDTPLTIENLVAVMQELGISSVAGISDQRDHSNWKLFYSRDDYLTLSLNTMPESCLNAAQLTVTLQPFEGAMSLGNGWVSCQ